MLALLLIVAPALANPIATVEAEAALAGTRAVTYESSDEDYKRSGLPLGGRATLRIPQTPVLIAASGSVERTHLGPHARGTLHAGLGLAPELGVVSPVLHATLGAELASLEDTHIGFGGALHAGLRVGTGPVRPQATIGVHTAFIDGGYGIDSDDTDGSWWTLSYNPLRTHFVASVGVAF